MNDSVIHARDLVKTFGDVRALDRVIILFFY